MNINYIKLAFPLLTLTVFQNSVAEDLNLKSCELRDSVKDARKQMLLDRLSPLFDTKSLQIADSGKDAHEGVMYTVSICSDVDSGKPNASVIQTQKTSSVVLGRNNDTDVFGGDSWVLLTYGSGDPYTDPKCVGPRKAMLMICCNEDSLETGLKFIEENKAWNTSCFYMFEVHTPVVCPIHSGLSSGSVFCIIFLTSLGVYLLIGIVYRRIVVGAKGFEQLPNHRLWRELGNLQADGCSYVCRREEKRDDSWTRITNNLSDSDTRDDDALLRP